MRTYILPERFHKALRSINQAFAEMEVDVVGQIGIHPDTTARPGSTSKILLVSAPILDFRALALGRAAAVFLPLHVLVTGDGAQTKVSLINPRELLDARLPPGTDTPMEELVGRVVIALDSLEQKAASPCH